MHRTITTCMNTQCSIRTARRFQPSHRAVSLGLLLDRQRYKVVGLGGTKPGGNPSAPCRNVCACIWRALTVVQLPRDRIGTTSPGSQILPSPDLFRPTCNCIPSTLCETFLANGERISHTVIECNGARPWARLNERSQAIFRFTP
jgi:hypothetical protein